VANLRLMVVILALEKLLLRIETGRKQISDHIKTRMQRRCPLRRHFANMAGLSK
jgi:hypothetical protein